MKKQNNQTKILLYTAIGLGFLIMFVLLFISFVYSFGFKVGRNSYPTEITVPENTPATSAKKESSETKEVPTPVTPAKIASMSVFTDKKTAVGQEINIKSTSTFPPEGYSFEIKKIDDNNMIFLEYDKAFLGSPCSDENGKGLLEIPRDIETCLISTTCDAGDTVCFKNLAVDDGIELQHSVERYDGEAGL